MRRGSLLWLVCLAGCTGGHGGVGDPCNGTGDCGDSLQCTSGTCAPLCVRAPDCGDGYSCSATGACERATGELGDTCASRDDCVAGLTCALGSAIDGNGEIVASCAPEAAGHPAGAACTRDADCRDEICELGRCVDLCRDTRDCGVGTSCVHMPREQANGALFQGCLASQGTLAWTIPISAPEQTVALPIPSTAQSIAVTVSVDDPMQEAAVTHLYAPDGTALVSGSAYTDPVRFFAQLGQATLAMPSSPDIPLVAGDYPMTVSSLRAPYDGMPGTATPSVTAVVKLDNSVILDLHFYFLNFDEFPCADSAFGSGAFGAGSAETASYFQSQFLGEVRSVFAFGGVALGSLDYTDLRDRPDLDGLDVSNASALLALGSNATGVNVFFVRSLSPAGLQAWGPNPGPAGLGGTGQSGVVVALDTLCYRSWADLGRVAAHEIAHYMGLYDNVQIDQQTDPIMDSDESSANLMFYSELGGTQLSPGQQTILSHSVVLR